MFLKNSYETRLQQQFKRPWIHKCLDNEYVLLYTLIIEPNRTHDIAVRKKNCSGSSFSIYLKTDLVDTKSFHWPLASNGQWNDFVIMG